MNELKINGFSAVSENEMIEVDAGGWKAFWCSIGGAAIGLVVGLLCPPVAVATAVTVGAAVGSSAGIALEN